jgi:hypothetical protein
VHTDIPTRADLERLLSVRDGVRLDLRADHARPAGRRPRIAFENLAGAAIEQQLHDLYARRVSQGRGTDDLGAISRAATLGAVDTAFVDIDETVPGFVDETDGTLTLDATDDAVSYGVVDEIARRVLRTRGRVLAVRRDDVPGGGPAAAILRYPV